MSAVTASLPYTISEADLREGTAAVVVTSGAYTLAGIPSGALVTGLQLIVDDAFDSATTATYALDIGGTSVLGATNVKVAGVTNSTTNLPLLLTSNEDLTGTLALVGATTKGSTRVVISYITPDGATLSYLGEA